LTRPKSSAIPSFQGIFESCPVAIAYVSLDGTFIKVNPAYARLLGYRPRELEGKRTFYDLTPREYHAQNRAAGRGLLSKGGAVEFEKEFVRKDGSRVPVQMTVHAVKDPGGRVVAFNAFIRDLTRLKEAERNLIRMEREVLEAVAREQRRIAQDLHDSLGQKLTGISLLSEALERRLEGREAPELMDARRIAAYAGQAVRESRELAKGLLPVELGGGLSAALEALAGYAREAFHISCRTRCGEDALVVDEGAALHLYRIAQEAVNNAVRHGRAGSVELSLGLEHGAVTLTIRDDGTGIGPEKSRKRGLGLGIMSYRARLLGATLVVRRLRGSGTAVVCRLPEQSSL